MLSSLRHLLPDSTSWRLVVERTLKKYLRGVAVVGSDTVKFVDDVYDDLWPDLTRELEEWEKQFDLVAIGTTGERRTRLEAAWADHGGQSPGYLQGVIQAAGYTDAYVYDWFDRTDVSVSTADGNIFSNYTGQDASTRGFCFAWGGRRLYIAGQANQSIFQYTLSSPYDLETVVYDEVSFDVSTENTSPMDVELSPDGTRMFVLGSTDPDSIFEYVLGTPFDVSTAVVEDSFSVFTKESVASGFSWHPDGTSVYVVGTGSDNVHQYDLTVGWDLDTISFTQTFDPTLTIPISVTFTPNGAHMFVLNLTGSILSQYDLSTAWDISTAGTVVQTLDLDAVDPTGLCVFIEHGFLFYSSVGATQLARLVFGGPRDPRSWTDQPTRGNTQCGNEEIEGLLVAAQCGEQPSGQTSFNSAVCNQFLANEVWYLWNDVLTQTAPPDVPDDMTYWPHFWHVHGSTYGTKFDIDYEQRQCFEQLLLRHGPTEQWIVTNMNVWTTTLIGEWKYELAANSLETGEMQFTVTADTPLKIWYIDADGAGSFDLDTASDSGDSADVSTETTTVRSVSFAGSKMYVCSLTDAYQYDLGEDYNPDGASYDSPAFDLTSDTGDSLHECIRVNAAGTYMYTLGGTNDYLYEWELVTPYDITTASFSAQRNIGLDAAGPLKFDISQDGTQIYVFGQTDNKIYRYTMPAWDLSQSVQNYELDLSGSDTEVRGVAISDDGTRLYVAGTTSTQYVYQYDLSTPYDLRSASLSTSKFDMTGFTTSPRGFSFSPVGDRFYIVEDTNDVVQMFNMGSESHRAEINAMASQDRFRMERSDDGSWIEYKIAAAVTDSGDYASIGFDILSDTQSDDWAGYPSSQGLMKFYHREILT